MPILQRRFHRRGNASVPQGLIQWSDQPDALATWEDLEELKQRFPHAPAWGQAGFQGAGECLAMHLLIKTRPATLSS